MSQFDFDRVIDRRNTGSLKYDLIGPQNRPADTIPLWVADMDFPAPPCVSEALREMTRPGIYGYSLTTKAYCQSVIGWFDRRFGWRPEEEWMVQTPGVVAALCTAVRAFTAPGDSVAMLMPVYHQFMHAAENNGRRVAVGRLKQDGEGRWVIDFAQLAQMLDEERPKLFILCSPHNPVGRVWTEAELRQLGELCFARNIPVIDDEIHCDFVYPGHRHIPFLTLGPEFEQNSICATAPSKTFNLAGMKCSNLFIPNPELRDAFRRELAAQGVGGANSAGMTACRAAYEGGAAWLDELLVYLRGNYDLLAAWCAENVPALRVSPLEGTYLAWVDARGLELNPEEEEDLLRSRARVWLSPGAEYGPGGEGFWRINLACPRSVLETALDRIKSALG